MYAYTANSFRAIRNAADALPGEAVAEVLPQTLLDALAASEAQRRATSDSIRTNAEQALVNLRGYRDLAAPTNAQTIAVVKLLCRVCISLIRLQLWKLDAVD